jgi:hypothetical protein
MLCPDHGRVPAHGLPYPDRSSVHVEQPHLIAVSATLAVDTDRGQKPGLPRLNKIRSNAEGGALRTSCTSSELWATIS